MESDDIPVVDIDEYLNSEVREDEEDSEEPILTPLTLAKANPLTALIFEYVDYLPEYPASDIQGYAYVVSARGRSQAEMEVMVNDIQYSKYQKYGQKRPVFCPFLNCQVKKYPMRCSGIRCCEFLAPQIKTYHHTTVDDSVWLEIQRLQSSIQLLEQNISKRNAYSYYRSKMAFFQRGHACLEPLPNCKPVFKRYPQIHVNKTYTPYIGCINNNLEPLSKHHQMPVQGHAALDLEFLEGLFNENILPPTEECGLFEPLRSRRQFCERDHPQGNGKLIHLECDVVFTALIPVDIRAMPYIIFVSHGIHKHPPPPPSKAPERILQGVKDVIMQMRDPSMTTAQFLRSPQLEEFCAQHQASTLTEIHASFCNKDRIAAIIQKQRLLTYPNGQDINGLIFLQSTDNNIKEYVQEYYHDAQNIMVLCGYKSQIQLLAQLSSFEVDMSYKRMRNKEMNEVVFATFLSDQAKIITLLRVFTNMDSTEGYYLLFKRAFGLLEKITGLPVQFDYLHGSGIHGIIVDMDPKQYSGLGKYLAEIDPNKHDSTWQLEHIIMFCRVHFQRNILKAIGTRNKGNQLWSRMMGLLTCQTEADYDALVDFFIDHEPSPAVKNWAIQKKGAVIKAGLNKACSKINPVYFDQIRNHTNAAEQSHQKAYAMGKYLTLVQAVKNTAKLDKDDIQQYQSFVDFNVHHSYRTSNMEANYLRHLQRERSRKRQRSHTESRSSSRSSTCQRAIRSVSQHTAYHGDTDSVISTPSLRQVASTNSLSLENRRKELEIRQLEANIQNQEEDIRLKQLEFREREAKIKNQEEDARLKQLNNDKLELELMEQRKRLQEEPERNV